MDTPYEPTYEELQLRVKELEKEASKLREVEAALRKSERFLSRVISQSPFPIWIGDNKGTILSCNKSLLDLLQLKEDELVGKYNILQDPLIEHLRDDVRAIFEKGENFVFEVQWEAQPSVGVDSPLLIIAGVVFPVFNENGEIKNTVAIYHDITELRQNEKKFKAIVEHVPVMICSFDKSGNCTIWNEELTQKLGYTLSEANKVDDIFALLFDQGEAIEFIESNSKNDGRFRLFHPTTKNGEKRHQEWAGFALPDKSSIFIGIDVTKRIKAEEELQQKERQFRYIFHGVSEGILLADPESKRFYMANRAICDMLGYTQEELLQLGIEDIHPADNLQQVVDAFERQLKGELLFATELPCRRKDGSVFYADISATQLVIDSRQSVLGCFRDVTERRQMATQLAQADRLSSMGMLAAGIAHEINNPLSYILYNLESLTDYLSNLLPNINALQNQIHNQSGADAARVIISEISKHINSDDFGEIQSQCNDALEGTRIIRDIVKGLGTFSRVERDQLVQVNITRVIEAALNMCFNEIRYRARIVKNFSKVPRVMASEGRLSQVFLNLFVNAAHAIDEGNVEDNEIRVSTWVDGNTVCVEVRDTGKGIEPEFMTHLFEPFFTTKEIGKGSGLGLPISKEIVEGYGGTITVESEVGKGTSILVLMPPAIQMAEVIQMPLSKSKPLDRQIRGRILIVDDEDSVRKVIAKSLSSHETIEASDGEAAKKILKQDQSFDLIISDMMMPNFSGMDLHAWLVENNPRLAKQFIFVSGGTFTPKARDYLKKIDNISIEKPFDYVNFKKIINEKVVMAKGLAQVDIE